MAKKKRSGHYCYVCGEYKPNEKFTGKGHARHICKQCQPLPDEVKADMVRCNDVMRLFAKYPFSRKDWELLEKYSKKYADKESGQLAQSILDDRRCRFDEEMDETEEPYEPMAEPVPFDKLEQYAKDIVIEFIAETASDYIYGKDAPFDETDFDKISEEARKDAKACYGIWILPDDRFKSIVVETANEIGKEIENIDDLPF